MKWVLGLMKWKNEFDKLVEWMIEWVEWGGCLAQMKRAWPYEIFVSGAGEWEGKTPCNRSSVELQISVFGMSSVNRT